MISSFPLLCVEIILDYISATGLVVLRLTPVAGVSVLVILYATEGLLNAVNVAGPAIHSQCSGDVQCKTEASSNLPKPHLLGLGSVTGWGEIEKAGKRWKRETNYNLTYEIATNSIIEAIFLGNSLFEKFKYLRLSDSLIPLPTAVPGSTGPCVLVLSSGISCLQDDASCPFGHCRSW